MILLWACAGPAVLPAESRPEADEEPGIWSVEQAAACENPAFTPIWEEQAGLPTDPYPPPTTDNMPGMEPGGVALLDAASGPLLLYIDPQATVWGYRLSDGTALTGLDDLDGVASFSIADLDNNGLPDLIASGLSVQILWDYDGLPGISSRHHLEGQTFVRDSVPADVDGDGDLDLVLTRTSPTDDVDALSALIWWNLGDRVFADPVAIEAPRGFWGKTFDATTTDLNRDGAPDLLICNDLGREHAPNGVLLNDGAGSLYAPEDALGLDVRSSCMGMGIGDLDQDGALDVSLGDAARHYFLRQTQSFDYVDASATTGLAVPLERQMYWGTGLADLDNSGAPELLLPSSSFWVSSAVPWPAYALERGADGLWTDRGPQWGLPQDAGTRSVLTADLNADGLPELIFGDGWRPPHVLWSQQCTAAGWIDVEVPEGSLVLLDAGGRVRAAQAGHDGSYGSAGRARVHLGLGTLAQAEKLVVRVPWKGAFILNQPIPTRSLVRLQLP